MSTFGFDPEETTHWEQTRPRSITPARWKQFDGYATEIFDAFGMDLDTPGTKDKPTRFLKALFDATAGYEGYPKLLTSFPTQCPDEATSNINNAIAVTKQVISSVTQQPRPSHG